MSHGCKLRMRAPSGARKPLHFSVSLVIIIPRYAYVWPVSISGHDPPPGLNLLRAIMAEALSGELISFVLYMQYTRAIFILYPETYPLSTSCIVCQLKGVNKPFQLGIQLGIDYEVCERFEKDHVGDTGRQLIEVIQHWLKNKSDCSWKKLARAVRNVGGHDQLAEKLCDLDLEGSSSASHNVPGK